MRHKRFPWMCRRCSGAGLEPGSKFPALKMCDSCWGTGREWRTVSEVLNDTLRPWERSRAGQNLPGKEVKIPGPNSGASVSEHPVNVGPV
jgi:hypothetical protein